VTQARLLCGDVREVLAGLPERSVQCVVTSPPYWGLRDYGQAGQLGLERTPEEYVANMVAVFRDVKRVLRDDGVLFLNLGDSYATDTAGWRKTSWSAGGSGVKKRNGAPGDLKPKDLVGIPWLTAFALRGDGWYLRSDIIWAKNNPMPESVTDRPTKAHEYLFLLSKGPTYYYDLEAIREPVSANWTATNAPTVKEMGEGVKDGTAKQRRLAYETPKGANARSVWTIATQPYAGAHFATMPEELARRCILAGSAARACEHCGAPWERVLERRDFQVTGAATGAAPDRNDGDSFRERDLSGRGGNQLARRTIGTDAFTPSCSCPDNTGAASSVVLDPFGGSGTTAAVAVGHGRRAIYIDLNPEYLHLARERIGPMLCDEPPAPAEVPA
jgi:DNA modification methylase